MQPQRGQNLAVTESSQKKWISRIHHSYGYQFITILSYSYKTGMKYYATSSLADDSLAHDVAHDLVGALQDLVHAAVSHVSLDIVILGTSVQIV